MAHPVRLLPVTLLLCLTCLGGTAAGQSADRIARIPPSELADRILEAAHLFLGTPYQYHATGPDAFDCSGFTRYIFQQFGIDLPHSSAAQAETGRELDGLPAHLQKGDLVFFSGRRIGDTVGHVGIFIEATDGGKSFRFIHAARGGVTVSEMAEEYYAKRYLGARRILGDFTEPEPVRPDPLLDSLKTLEGKTVEIRDTLSLSDADSRIVLRADGTWVKISADGTVRIPDEAEKLILEGNGRWHTLGQGSPARSQTGRDGTQTAEPVTDSAVYHTVAQGDTLGKLAARYHTTVSAICRLNGIQSTTILHIGRRLRVR